jgi:cytoskeleton protein RodZ
MSDKDKSDPAASGTDPIHDSITELGSGHTPDDHASADPGSADPAASMPDDTVSAASDIDADQISMTEPPASVETVSAADQAGGLHPEYCAESVAQQLPGALLAKRRKEFRLSVEDVSSRLKISPRQITALESDDFAQLASMATVRGFIRSYCKLLELDPAPLIAMLSSEPNPAFDGMVVKRPLPAPGLRGRQSPPPRRRNSSKWPALVIVAAVVAALVFIAYRYELFSVPSVDYAKVVDALPPLTGGREASSPEAESDKGGVLSSLGVGVSSASALEIKAREDSWVEVTTVEGERRLISRLMKAGTTELVEVNEPVVLVIGNAAGVDASLRGQTLNLRAVARDNVAKLSLK